MNVQHTMLLITCSLKNSSIPSLKNIQIKKQEIGFETVYYSVQK